MKKLVRIFDQYYNVDNIELIAPRYNSDKKEFGCTIWYNVAMSQEVFHTDITFGKNSNGEYKHSVAEIADHLNKGEDLSD